MNIVGLFPSEPPYNFYIKQNKFKLLTLNTLIKYLGIAILQPLSFEFGMKNIRGANKVLGMDAVF